MAEGKISIEIYKAKNAEEFTKLLADPDRKMETGSASADAAALAAALTVRAAALISRTAEKNERLDYILRNAEIIRAYMVHLIDEDVKCRAPLKRAIKEGGEREIEACRQSACCINAEIINMMLQNMGFLSELSALAAPEVLHYIGEAAELSLCAVRCSRTYILSLAAQSVDDTYRYVTKRENDISLGQCMAQYEAIMDKVEDAQ